MIYGCVVPQKKEIPMVMVPATQVSHATLAAESVEDRPSLLATLRSAWSPFTSAYITCESPNLAWGQSDVTALAVQERLGGEILRTTFETPCGKKGAHFFNLLPEGERVDVALAGYPQGTVFVPPLDAPIEALRAATSDYLQAQKAEGSLREHLLALTDNEASAESNKLRGVLSDDPPSERYAILQHNIMRAAQGRIGRG